MRRFAVLALTACSAPAEAPSHRPAPAPTAPRDEDLARLPDDIWAVGALDLAQLRDSLARRWIWQLAGEQSAVAWRCDRTLAQGTRATVAFGGDDAIYAIVHGVDTAAVAACARLAEAVRGDLPANQAPCDGFDAAVHAFAACGRTPETQVPALVAAAAQLGAQGSAACPAAQQAIEAAVKRRDELGASCRPREHRAAHVAAQAEQVGKALVFGGVERLDFLDSQTVAITIAGGKRALADAKLAPARHARWFESMANGIDRTRGGWAIADLKQLAKEPAAVAISGGLRGDLAIDVQIAYAPGHLTNELLAIATRAVDDPDFAGAKLALGCAPATTAPRIPKLRACEAAEQRIAGAAPTQAIDDSGLRAERAARCVADHWPDDYVACVGKAADERAVAACSNQLSAADRERVEGGLESACRDRAFAVHVTYPDARIEALKLANAMGEVVHDCRMQGDGPVSAMFAAQYLTACRGDLIGGRIDGCVQYDATTGRLELDRAGTPTACVGPLHLAGPAWRDARGQACAEPFAATDARPAIDPLKLPKDAIAISADGKRALGLAKGVASVVELPSGKPLGRLALGKGCTDAAFLGDLVLVGCGAKSYLATPAGRSLAVVGDVALAPLPLPDHRWALVSRTGDRVDLYSGAGAKSTELAVPHRADVIDAVTDGAGAIAIAYGGTGPDGGAVALIDAKQQLRVLAAPICPPLPGR